MINRLMVVLAVSALVLGTAGVGAVGAQSTQPYETDFNQESYKCLSPDGFVGVYRLVSVPKSPLRAGNLASGRVAPGYMRVLAEFQDRAACHAEGKRVLAPFKNGKDRVFDPQNKRVLQVPNPVVDLQKPKGTSASERTNAENPKVVRVTGGQSRLTPEQDEQRRSALENRVEARIANAKRAAQARVDAARRLAERLGDAALEALGRKPGSAAEALFNAALNRAQSNTRTYTDSAGVVHTVHVISPEDQALFKAAGIGNRTPEQDAIARGLATQSAAANAALDAAIAALAAAEQAAEPTEREIQCYATPEDC